MKQFVPRKKKRNTSPVIKKKQYSLSTKVSGGIHGINDPSNRRRQRIIVTVPFGKLPAMHK